MFDRIRKQVNTGLLVTLASIVVPVLIFVVALKLGFKDTDLPVSLTMRRGSFDLDLFRGIENDIEAAQLLTFGENLREIIHYHADPFFILAVLFPTRVTAILYSGYLVRFGLAGLFMQRLVRKRMTLEPASSLVLSTAYSLSSVVVSVASYTCAMNIAVLMPLVLDRLIAYMTDRKNVTGGLLFAFAFAALVWISGPFCFLLVIPFVLFSAFWCALLVTRKMSEGFLRFLGTLPYILTGVILSLGVIINTLKFATTAIIEEDILTLGFRSTFFDFLVGFEGGKGLGTRPFSLTCYFTVFLFITVLLFFMNSSVPFRIRMCLLTGIVFIFLTFSSEAAYRVTTLYKAEIMPSESAAMVRFVSLMSLLIVAAAVSLKNIRYVDKRMIGVCVASAIVLSTVSNNSQVQISPNSFSLFFSWIAAIASYFILRSVAEKKRNGVVLTVLCGLCLNLAFILPISSFGISYDADSALFDRKDITKSLDYPFEELAFFNEEREDYMLLYDLPSDLGDDVDTMNKISIASGSAPVFMRVIDAEDFFGGGRVPLINGNVAQNSGMDIVAYKNIRLTDVELARHLVLYTDHTGKVNVDTEMGDGGDHYSFKGPGIIEIDNSCLMDFNVIVMTDESALMHPDECYDFYTVNDVILKDLRSRQYPLEDSFEVYRTGEADVITVLTGLEFDPEVEVRVNGSIVETVPLAGKISFDIDPSIDNEITIMCGHDIFLTANVISFLALISSIVLLMIMNVRGQKREDDKIGRL